MSRNFRKSIKIAPGVRVNFSKSGMSTSFGGKGFTYNTRGRISVGIPGTGIRYTTYLKSRKADRRANSGAAASTGPGYMSTENLSKREQAAQDFVQKIRTRTTSALLQYFLSHGVFVDEDRISEAIELEDHQPFLNTLSHDLSLTTKAVRLASDIGTVSLAEKEKAMLALYELERKCAAARGTHGDLENAASALLASVRAWPRTSRFMGPMFVGLLGCLIIAGGSVPVGLALTGLALAYGGYRTFAFMRKRAACSEAIRQANAWFQSRLTVEVVPRPAVRANGQNVPFRAGAYAVVIVVAAVCALIVSPRHATSTGDREQLARQSGAAASTANNAGPSAVAAATDDGGGSAENFSWLLSKAPSEVVNDKRFRSAFNGISRAEWKKISQRLAVANAAGIQSQDGYMIGQGCKAHQCQSDQAAFVIDMATGKGVMLVKDSSSSSENGVTKAYQWPGQSASATPLATWAQENAADSNPGATATSVSQPASAPAFMQTSFDCSKARSDSERIICGDAELASADVQLAAIYLKAKGAATDADAFKKRTRAQWNYREQQCHDRECLVRWYADQKIVLTEIAATGRVVEE